MDVDAAEEAVESEFDQIDAVRACSAETRTSSHPVLTNKRAHIHISLAFVQSLTQHSTVTHSPHANTHTHTPSPAPSPAHSHTPLCNGSILDPNGIEALERTRTCLVLRCALTSKAASRRFVPQCCSSAAEIPLTAHPPPSRHP